jgi:hypothetical protein
VLLCIIQDSCTKSLLLLLSACIYAPDLKQRLLLPLLLLQFVPTCGLPSPGSSGTFNSCNPGFVYDPTQANNTALGNTCCKVSSITGWGGVRDDELQQCV